MDQVIDSIDQLSSAWLARALDADVRSVSAERIGTGQMAATYRLMLEADELPTTMVAKLATGDDRTRQRVKDGYRREVGFYRDIAGTVDVSVPHCWYAEISDDGLRFTLLLDDLQPMTPGVQFEGCTIARAHNAVRNLAALHAPRWNDASLFDAEFLSVTSEEGAAFLGAVTVAATDEFVARYETELGATDVATLRASAAATATWQLTRPEPFAVSHGDYRLDNLMFAPVGEGVAAVDWQTLAVAPPARDLAYFLGTSLRTEDRRDTEAELVGAYHDELTTRGVSGYSASECFDDYRLGQLQGPMITTLGCIYAPNARTEASDAMFLTMARRSCAAIRELGSLEILRASEPLSRSVRSSRPTHSRSVSAPDQGSVRAPSVKLICVLPATCQSRL